GLLSFGHSAFFGIGAYSVAFLLRYADIHSMELYVLIGLPIAAVISALFGYICVRHTRIFFGILTLALSQVLWTLAYKFFWVTGARTACAWRGRRCSPACSLSRAAARSSDSSTPITTTSSACSRFAS